jgi:antitoxin component YwqK of YwqJK toxin-antitoxin module
MRQTSTTRYKMIRLIIFTSIFILPTWTFACSCNDFGGPVTIKDYNANQFIFSGKAKKVSIDKNETVDKQRQIDFEINEVFKGYFSERIIKIYTSLSDASCGLLVKENEEWIMWAYIQDNVVSTNLCTKSVKKEGISATDLQSLKYFKSNPSATEWRNELGVTIATGKIEGNIPVGHWKYFYPDGSVEMSGSYLNGKENGKWIIYLDPKGIVTRLHYDKVIPTDSIPDLELFKNRIKEIHNYRQGIREGEFIYYAYYSIDKPTRVQYYKNGQLDGKSIGYHSNGLIYYEQNYKEGKLDGYERFYHPNGQLKQVGLFINSKPTGEFKVFNESGELIKTSTNKRPE